MQKDTYEQLLFMKNDQIWGSFYTSFNDEKVLNQNLHLAFLDNREKSVYSSSIHFWQDI